jgi:peptide/nickel transport system substrate-binding protein
VLERNPSWWGEPTPYFRRITVWTVENTAALEANLLAGGIDMVAGELGFCRSTRRWPSKNAMAATFRNVSTSPASLTSISISISTIPSWPTAACARRCSYGIDRKAISDELFAGRDPVADSFVPPLDWIYTPDVPRYPYRSRPRPRRCSRRRAGTRTGGDTPQNDKPASRLALELATTSRQPQRAS